MRKVIFQMMVTLDGFYAGPNGEIDWHNVDEEVNVYAEDFLSSVDALLFGRVTYELEISALKQQQGKDLVIFGSS